MNDSEELIDAASDLKRDPSSDKKLATYTTNGKCSTKIIEEPVRPKDHPRRNISY